jgi:hypothetical protein
MPGAWLWKDKNCRGLLLMLAASICMLIAAYGINTIIENF